ncbi:MAG: ATP-binding cassette domain-containing protein [Spirochaetaceae bacterium]|nr:ATP-binding cassette domain-containing protein [Spirochaetaceae bacterium]
MTYPGGIRAVRDVSISIAQGEVLALIGESGSGKTSLARALASLVPYSGQVSLMGNPVSSLNRLERSRRLQLVFQNPYTYLNPAKTVGQILEEPLIIHARGKRPGPAMTEEMLTALDLDPAYRTRSIRELSGGERQRVAIGCALMLNPSVILADEALSALDVLVQARILALLRSHTCLFISHDISAAAYFSHRIAVMYRGEIVEEGPTERVYTSPRHPYTQRLLRKL